MKTASGADRIKQLWDIHVVGDKPFPKKAPSGIRPEIFESWRRSKAFGISPFEVKGSTTETNVLLASDAMNRKLISVAHPYIENLYDYVRGSDFVIALTERSGVVIDLIGLSGNIEQRAKKSALTIGCSRSENVAGTCGIGTCLALGAPIQIWGAEHYIKPHHNYVCSAAPIKNETGEIVACIDVIGPSERVTDHTLGMVCAAADGIEKEFKMIHAYDQLSIMAAKLSSTLESLSQGIVMIDNDGIVTQTNENAKSVLRLPETTLAGARLHDLLDFSKTGNDVFSLTENTSHMEMNVTNCKGIRLNLSISASVLLNDAGEKISTVLILEERRTFNKVATQVSGFTAKYSFDQIFGVSKQINEIKQLGMLAAQSDSSILIIGENGTGKDLLAQSIHNAGPRAHAPFIAVNCGSIPRNLIESDLFGFEAGAFTNVNRDSTPGKFELADGGTLFLDEIGDMPIEIQATLLRAIQTHEIFRVGSNVAKRVNVRIIAATDVSLAELIENRRFRKDLYYRLNVLSFRLPALRERREDLPVLIDKFIETSNARMGSHITGLSPAATQLALSYEWPGNIRELEHVIERAMNLTEGTVLTEDDLGPEIQRESYAPAEVLPFSRIAPGTSVPRRKNSEERIIRDALVEAHGNVTKAARTCGIPKRTLYRRIEAFGIDIKEFRV
jgi:transcriptional regulator of acetoin/glycerol metabolism